MTGIEVLETITKEIQTIGDGGQVLIPTSHLLEYLSALKNSLETHAEKQPQFCTLEILCSVIRFKCMPILGRNPTTKCASGFVGGPVEALSEIRRIVRMVVGLP